jgi:hypothetical protein
MNSISRSNICCLSSKIYKKHRSRRVFLVVILLSRPRGKNLPPSRVAATLESNLLKVRAVSVRREWGEMKKNLACKSRREANKMRIALVAARFTSSALVVARCVHMHRCSHEDTHLLFTAKTLLGPHFLIIGRRVDVSWQTCDHFSCVSCAFRR